MFLFIIVSVSAQEHTSYLDDLIVVAQDQGLAKKRHWHFLLHYRKNSFLPGVTSFIDDPNFFNAPDGKTNPEEELEATLKSFFEQANQCRFIARYHWLKEKLDFDSTKLPKQSCDRFNTWHTGLNTKGISLIFPTSYLNNPASMFGHTFIRLDAGSDDLLSYSANYAATTGSDGGMTFAIKGLFGGYHGFFSILPYYEKILAYSDLENRDIWEYQLQFTQEETERVIRHLWELRNIYFEYYFFDENCSFHLLSLFEVARPELELSNRFFGWAIPIDTIRVLIRNPNTLGEIVFRPGRRNMLGYRLQSLQQHEQLAAQRLAEGSLEISSEKLQALPQERAAQVLELGYEYLQYQVVRGKIKQEESKERSYNLLLARSKLDVPAENNSMPQPQVRPDEGHETFRFSLGGGFDDDRAFYEFGFRPAYHDLLDPPGGYTKGAQIQFFNIRARHTEEENVQLEEFTPVDIISLSPQSLLFKPISWKIGTGLRRKRFPDARRHLVFRIQGGPGLTYSLWGETLLYGFVDTTFETHEDFEDKVALGFGPNLGLLTNISERLGGNLFGSLARFNLGDDHTVFDVGAETRFTLNRNNAFRLRASRERSFDEYATNINLSWQLFF